MRSSVRALVVGTVLATASSACIIDWDSIRGGVDAGSDVGVADAADAGDTRAETST